MSTPGNSINNSINIAVPSKKLKTSTATTTATTMAANRNNADAAEGNDEFQIARDYLLQCPLLGQNSPAITAALEGIEKEEKRIIRDAKLRSKFGKYNDKQQTKSSSNNKKNTFNLHDGDEVVLVEKYDGASDSFVLEGKNCIGNSSTSNNNINNDNDDDMEWQDIQQQQKDEDTMVPSVGAIGDSFTIGDVAEECFLGETLAKACIDAIAQQQTQRNRIVGVSSPLAAIAVALHASLRSDILGFACTGVPEEKKKTKGKSIGFAPPIRELPKTEFLPRGWDDPNKNKNHHQTQNLLWSSPEPLRYRKSDTGALVLTVEGHSLNDEEGTTTNEGVAANGCTTIECRVIFSQGNSSSDKEEAATHRCLKFLLSEHINLDSWNAAALKTGGGNNHHKYKIAPSLHYKNLSGLLGKFCRTFDLGAVQNDDSVTGGYEEAGMMRTKIIGNNSNSSSSKMEASGVFAEHHHDTSNFVSNTMKSNSKGYSVPATLDQAFPVAAAYARLQAAEAARRLVDHPPPHHRGDFADDLLPSGLQDPRFGRIGGRMGGSGNLMGPNHPMFAPRSGSGDFRRGNLPGGLPIGGPGTMQPRFDPIVPPYIGGGDDLLPPTAESRFNRRSEGGPNPDHLPPPNSLGGNNMYM